MWRRFGGQRSIAVAVLMSVFAAGCTAGEPVPVVEPPAPQAPMPPPPPAQSPLILDADEREYIGPKVEIFSGTDTMVAPSTAPARRRRLRPGRRHARLRRRRREGRRAHRARRYPESAVRDRSASPRQDHAEDEPAAAQTGRHLRARNRAEGEQRRHRPRRQRLQRRPRDRGLAPHRRLRSLRLAAHAPAGLRHRSRAAALHRGRRDAENPAAGRTRERHPDHRHDAQSLVPGRHRPRTRDDDRHDPPLRRRPHEGHVLRPRASRSRRRRRPRARTEPHLPEHARRQRRPHPLRAARAD